MNRRRGRNIRCTAGLLTATLAACAVAVVALVQPGCEHMPTAIEQTGSVSLRVEDGSSFMKSLKGDSTVANAEVLLRSVNYGLEFKGTTNSQGIAQIAGLVSDIYSVSVVCNLNESDVQTVTGAFIKRRLSGGMSALGVRADRPNDLQTVTLDLMPISDIIISELYTCGAPGAGLYWHDKYVEVFNMGDSVRYLDGLVIAEVGKGWLTAPDIHSDEVWKFPGNGTDYPIRPGEIKMIATDAIDHRINAPQSVDERIADFEFYLKTGPDIDNTQIPNMIMLFQPNGFDWLMGGEGDAFVLARVDDPSALPLVNDDMLIPKSAVIDGVEYLKDPTRLDLKKLDPKIDAGAAGGIQFYTGKSNERKGEYVGGKLHLQDNNNSSLDFVKIEHPTPKTHFLLSSSGSTLR
jgi:hypothetical protein